MHLREWVSSCLVGFSVVFAIHATAQEARTPSAGGVQIQSGRRPLDIARRPQAGLPPGAKPMAIRPRPADVLTSPPPPFGGFYGGAYFSAAGSDYTAGYFPVAGDFNHDGKADIVTFAFGVICMRPGNGDGTFGAPILTLRSIGQPDYGNSPYIAFAQAADLNGDGYTDLVAGNNYDLSVLLNQKDGTFAVTSLPIPPPLPNSQEQIISAIAVGATTASGHPDVVEVWTDPAGNTVAQTFLNDGTGGFAASKVSSYNSSSGTLLPGPTVSLADVNHDGHLDLVIEKQVSSGFGVEIALGNGDGSFAAPQPGAFLNFPSGASFSADLLVTSLTGDPARQDILVATSYGAYAALSNGDGTYQAPKPALPNDPIAAPLNEQAGSATTLMGVQAADFNGDGKPDLILTVGEGLAVYLGNGDGTFGPVAGTASLSSNFVGLSTPSGNNLVTATQTIFADWNGDGKMDFAFADPFSDYIGIGLGDGKGDFAATPLLYSPGTPHVSPLGFYAGATADLNGDGIADLLGYNSVDGSLVSALATGKGAFLYKQALPGSVFDALDVGSTTADFNGDGKADFLIDGKDGSVAVALSNGDGTVQTPVPIPVITRDDCEVIYAAAGDLNGDGKLDLVVSYPADAVCDTSAPTGSGRPSGYFVALGNGDGTFSSENVQFYPLGISLQAVALARYHGAQKPRDLIVSDNPQAIGADGGGASVSLLAGNGDGTFAPPVSLDEGHAVEQLLTDDYNLDGRPDLTLIADLNFSNATETTDYGGVFVLAGNGDGTFAGSYHIPGAPGSFAGAFVDVNGDGRPDLIVSDQSVVPPGGAGQAASGVSVLLATGPGTFAPPLNYPNAAYPLLVGNFLGDNTVSIVGPGNGAAGFLMNQGGTSITLTPSASSIAAGQPLTLSAALLPTLLNRPAPSGLVTLYDGQTPIGQGVLSDGSFAFNTSALATGTHTLAVSYGGDGSFNPNRSGAVSVTVTAPLPPTPDYQFTLSASDLTIVQGQSGTLGVTIAANPSLSASVSFACSGLPAEAACTFNPASLNVTPGQTGTAVITIATKAASSAQARLDSRSPFLLPAGAALAGILCWMLPLGVRARRLWMVVLAAVCLATGSAVLTGCGGSAAASGPGAPTDPGTPAGSSVVTVTATAISGTTTVTHTAMVTLGVQ